MISKRSSAALTHIVELDESHAVLHRLEEGRRLLVRGRHWLPLWQRLRDCVHGQEERPLALHLAASPVALKPSPTVPFRPLRVFNLLLLLQNVENTVNPVIHRLDLFFLHAFLEISGGHLPQSFHNSQQVRPDLFLGLNRVKTVRQLVGCIVYLCCTDRQGDNIQYVHSLELKPSLGILFRHVGILWGICWCLVGAKALGTEIRAAACGSVGRVDIRSNNLGQRIGIGVQIGKIEGCTSLLLPGQLATLAIEQTCSSKVVLQMCDAAEAHHALA
ncbi:hypothetical protein HG530_004894 [Fusarium avenaceum]|nr:hypothetical protein HG530_004894 [Fusarium avenaceum]